MSEQHVYFDASDEDGDGYGWNVVEPGTAIAARYGTELDAAQAAVAFGAHVIVLRDSIQETAEAIAGTLGWEHVVCMDDGYHVWP